MNPLFSFNRIRSAGAVAWAGALALACTVAVAQPRCLDEQAESLTAPDAEAGASTTATTTNADPRITLEALVREALARSNAIGAARLLAEAAADDIDEARAAKSVQASVGGGVGPGGSRSGGVTETAAAQMRATLNVSQLLWDGGRSDRLVDWKSALADSARFGQMSQQEQLALNTVSLALERSRWRMTAQVYRHHVRRATCLVEALDTIVRADRGRASELVQARKTLQQAELSLAQAHSSGRQVDVRLRRLVGDGLPGTEGFTTVFVRVPDLAQLVADVERAADIAQLDAQAAAAKRYSEAVAAGNKPQVSWSVTGSAAAGQGKSGGLDQTTRSGSYSVGLMLSIPLMNPGFAPATDASRKRAQAAVLNRADALESRRFRVAELHEQAAASADRATRLAAVLRDSDQVRNFTLQQWQQLGRRSLFDVMAAEGEHYNLRVSYVNALHDVQQLNANLLALGRGVAAWLK